MSQLSINFFTSVLLLSSFLSAGTACAASLSSLEQLGKDIFFDHRLSSPEGQSCATCHAADAGWTMVRSDIHASGAVHPGAVSDRFSNRKPPSIAYASLSPPLYYDAREGLFIGGNFWDGRATGWLLGKPVADQAQRPFLNPVEQNNADIAAVVSKVCSSAYADDFRSFFGSSICKDPQQAFNAIAQAISAFENSAEVNAFSSKYDYYLRDPQRYPLTEQEVLGLRLFEDEKKGNCAACHPSQPGANGEPPLFTDFSYDNLGIPVNTENPWYSMPERYNPEGKAWRDLALGGFLRTVPRFASYAAENDGKHKVSTLRNVDQRPAPGFIKSFGHNGFFKSLKAFVHFYNTRDTLPDCAKTIQPIVGDNCWPRAEVQQNVNKEELGDLGLSEAEEDAIVAFMKTLTDGWSPGPSK